MNKEELKLILESHNKWLKNEEGGVKADLSGSNLRYANLHGADLCGADLHGVDLHGANLRGVDLCGADLRYANLHGVDLCGADLRYANLHGADLCGADLDFSQLNLSCKGLNFKIDERLAKQIAYHLLNLIQYSDLDTSMFNDSIYKWLETSHLVLKHELPILKNRKGGQ